MRHLHYGNLVIAISDALAEQFLGTAVDYANEGKSVVLPIAGYVDAHEVTIEVIVGPGVPFLIAEPLLPDTRDDAKNTAAAIDFLTDVQNDLDQD
jgi:hypothetical protein